MRRVLLILAAVAAAVLLTFASFKIFSGHSTELTFDEISSADRTVTRSGVFSGRFKSDKEGFRISGYDVTVENNKIYVTLTATVYGSKALPIDDEGYTSIEFDAGTSDVVGVYYRQGGKNSAMGFDWR